MWIEICDTCKPQVIRISHLPREYVYVQVPWKIKNFFGFGLFVTFIDRESQ